MANASESSSREPGNEQGWLQVVSRKPKQASVGLFVAAILLAIGVGVLAYVYRWDVVPVCIWGGVLAVIALGAGLWLSQPRQAGMSDLDSTRLLVLAVGGLSGLATVLLSIALTYEWWIDVSGGWKVWQGSGGRHIWIIVLALIAGLIVMFASFQLARTDERSNPTLRWLLYGYNAVLGGIFLLGIILVLNVLVYIPGKWNPLSYLNRNIDWTTASIYSLSDKSEHILEGLKKPTKVYVLLTGRDLLYRQISALLDNCTAVTDKLQVQYLSPDLNQDEVNRLAQEYKIGGERKGILVVSGSGAANDSQFIRYNDLIETQFSMDESKPRAFKGESALMTALQFLSEGKQKPVIYFTQGEGEYSTSDSNARGREEASGVLRQRLEAENYTAKGLQFSVVEEAKSKNPDTVVAKEVPADAAAVIMIGPRRLPENAREALQKYMDRKGKLVVLLDVPADDRALQAEEGLEKFLAQYNVRVGNERILRLPSNLGTNPVQVFAIMNQDAAVRGRNPVVSAFADEQFPLYGVRTVQAAQPSRPGGGGFVVDPLLIAPSAQGVWKEANLGGDPFQISNELITSKKVRDRLSEEDLPIAVTASEEGQPAANDPHAFMAPREQKPRLVVFGSATWASNLPMAERGSGARYYDLFASSLAWLRERPSDIGIEPKKSDIFVMKPNTNISRMIMLPAIGLFVGVVGMGVGVWVVRRR